MDKVRRGLVMTAPLVPLLGLQGCGGGDNEASANSANPTSSSGSHATAQGVTPSNSLTINGSNYALGFFWALPDTIFQSSASPYFTPDASLQHGVMNSGVLVVTLWMGVGTQQRGLTLKFSAPGQGASYNVANMSSGDAVLAVTVMQYDSTAGQGNSSHYEYLLNSGTIQITTLSANSATLKFTTVKGTPTPTTLAPNNVASRAMQLDGTVTVALASAQTVNWIV